MVVALERRVGYHVVKGVINVTKRLALRVR
jgi:hypothetical protein